ncbi:MAG: nucleotide exchange factor GrpE [Egibacteraceae bacterium]
MADTPDAKGQVEAPERRDDALAEAEPVPVEPEDQRSAEELRAALAETERLRDDYLDQLRRARADYENLNKRKTRELMDALDRGAAGLVARLLDVLDNFALALDAARSSADERLAKGVGMVHAGLLDVLKQAGLEEVPGVGAPFDPNWHEALVQVEASEALVEAVDAPVVVEVLRTGYRLKGRVLRPASVKVAR